MVKETKRRGKIENQNQSVENQQKRPRTGAGAQEGAK
jgi:hypothetical protein